MGSSLQKDVQHIAVTDQAATSAEWPHPSWLLSGAWRWHTRNDNPIIQLEEQEQSKFCAGKSVGEGGRYGGLALVIQRANMFSQWKNPYQSSDTV